MKVAFLKNVSSEQYENVKAAVKAELGKNASVRLAKKYNNMPQGIDIRPTKQNGKLTRFNAEQVEKIIKIIESRNLSFPLGKIEAEKYADYIYADGFYDCYSK